MVDCALWYVSWLPALWSVRHSENWMKKEKKEKKKKMILAGMERASMQVDVVNAKTFTVIGLPGCEAHGSC
jgi:hypothetical protein